MFDFYLSDESIDLIKSIFEQMKRLPHYNGCEVFYVEDGGAGSKTILILKNGGLVSNYYFYPGSQNSQISSIAIYGQHLKGHVRTISSSGFIFGLPITSIELVTEDTNEPFVDIFIGDY